MLNEKCNLIDHETQLEVLCENGTNLYCVTDHNNRFVGFNSNFKKIVKTFNQIDIKPGDSVYDINSTFEHGLFDPWDEIQLKVFKGEHVSTEKELKINNESSIWKMMYYPIIKDKEVVGVSFFSREITEKRNAQKKLEEANIQLKMLSESIDEVLFSVTFNPVKVIFISKGCQKVYGYNQEDFYGNPDLWSDVIIEEDNKVVEDIYEQIKTGETVFCKYRIRNKDGRVCWLGSKIFPTLDKDGKLVRIDGINTDISKRKINESNLIEANNQAEQSNKELIRTLNHFNRAQKIAHVGSWTLKFADKDAIWSDEACRIYGLLPNDNKQSYESWLSFIHPDDLEWVKMEISNSLETLTNTSFNHRIVLRDRTVKFINSVRMFELDEEGNAIGMYGIWFDITESKKAETDIIAKNIELEKINKELDRFVYSISHELRSPLTSVMGLLNIFKEEKSEERNREYIDMISRSVYKMDETLREILDYSRNSRNAITDEEIDLNILIKDIFNSNQYLENEITFKKRLNIVNKEPFYADKARLKVVLNNIISNAIKYRKKNYYNSFIKIDAIVNREKLILEIEDNGIGIHEKYVKGLGGMFFRATTEASGSGLGLYITKECVEKLNGSFSIQSEFGLGTKIRIEIPNHLKEII